MLKFIESNVSCSQGSQNLKSDLDMEALSIVEIKITQDSKSGIEATKFDLSANDSIAAPHATGINPKSNNLEKYSDSPTHLQDYFEIVDMFTQFF